MVLIVFIDYSVVKRDLVEIILDGRSKAVSWIYINIARWYEVCYNLFNLCELVLRYPVVFQKC